MHQHVRLYSSIYKSPQVPWGALRSSLSFKSSKTRVCSQVASSTRLHQVSTTPAFSHPLINSTQHHFLHSLTVPSLCVCVCVLASEARIPPMPVMAEVGEREVAEEHIREQTAAGPKAAALWSPPGGLRQPQPLFAPLCSPWLALGRQRGDVGEDLSYSTSRLW